MSDTDRTDVSLKSIPYSSLPLLKDFKGATVERLPRSKSNKKTDHDIYSIPSSTESRPSTPEDSVPRQIPTPEPTPPTKKDLRNSQTQEPYRGAGLNNLPDGDTIVVLASRPPLRPAARSEGVLISRGLKRKRDVEPRSSAKEPPPNRKKTRSTRDEEATTTSYETRSAVQSSRISPDLGTTIMDFGSPVPKTEELSGPVVPSYRWVDIAPITFEQPNTLSSLEATTTPSAVFVEIRETPPSSPPLAALDTRGKVSRTVVPKDETPTPTLVEPTFDISTIPVHFLSPTDKVMRTRPFHTFRNGIQRFFMAADGANIINEDVDKLTVRIYRRGDVGLKGEAKEMNVMRDFEEDLEEMREAMQEMSAVRVEVRRGRKSVLVN